MVAGTPSLALAGGAPTRLILMEDSSISDDGFAWRVTPPAGARVLEVRTAADWLELVRRHPLEVTESRWSVWGETTRRLGRWVIPDWQAVA